MKTSGAGGRHFPRGIPSAALPNPPRQARVTTGTHTQPRLPLALQSTFVNTLHVVLNAKDIFGLCKPVRGWGNTDLKLFC